MTAQSVKKFMKILDDIDRSKRRGEVFADVCELAYCALAKNASPFADQREALEEQYMSVVGRYRNKDDVRRMPELLALTLGAISLGGIDFLGQVAGEIGALDAGLGQFFTPYEVSRLMAEINLTNAAELIEKHGFLTVQEPAAGACGMVLAIADVIEGQGFDPARHLWVEAVELSRSTYYMGYIQMSARSVAGKMVCGNSLSLEIYTSAYTAAAPQFIAANGHPFAAQRVANAEKVEKENHNRQERLQKLTEQKPAENAIQLNLFGDSSI